jgi:hypothetical protein
LPLGGAPLLGVHRKLENREQARMIVLEHQCSFVKVSDSLGERQA